MVSWTSRRSSSSKMTGRRTTRGLAATLLLATAASIPTLVSAQAAGTTLNASASATATLASSSAAAAPSSTAAAGSGNNSTAISICAKYAPRVLGENTPDTQWQFMGLLVNTLFIGNYSNLAVGGSAPGGILTKNGRIDGVPAFSGQSVDLYQYFDGSLVSTNRNGMPRAVNFLDGGGISSLQQSLPANDSTSNQHFLMTHLYSWFGLLFACDGLGQDNFQGYSGETSMGKVHKYMDLSDAEWSFFLQQFGYSMNAFNMESTDIRTMFGLMANFHGRCLAPFAFPSNSPVAAQSICTGQGCPAASTTNNGDCTYADNNGTSGIAPQQAAVFVDSSTGSGSGSSSNHAGAIAGGVVGGILALLLIGAGIYLLRHKKKKQAVVWEHEHDAEIPERKTYASPAPPASDFGSSSNFAGAGAYSGPSILTNSARSRPTSPDAFSNSDYYDSNGRPNSLRAPSVTSSRRGGATSDVRSAEQRSIAETLGSSTEAFPVGRLPPNAPPMYERYVSQNASRMGGISEEMPMSARRMQDDRRGVTPDEAHPGFQSHELSHIPRDVDLPPDEAQRLVREAQEARAAAMLARQQQQQQPASGPASSSHAAQPSHHDGSHQPSNDEKDPRGPSYMEV